LIPHKHGDVAERMKDPLAVTRYGRTAEIFDKLGLAIKVDPYKLELGTGRVRGAVGLRNILQESEAKSH
jgi:hypothetical protein